MMDAYRIEFPTDFDTYATETAAKGYFADLTIEAGGKQSRPVFYDSARLAQEITDTLREDGWYAERNIVVLTAVMREHIVAAVDGLAKSGFQALSPEIDKD